MSNRNALISILEHVVGEARRGNYPVVHQELGRWLTANQQRVWWASLRAGAEPKKVALNAISAEA